MNSTSVTNLRKSSLVLAIVAAVFGGSAFAATPGNALVTVAHATTIHRGDAITGALPLSHPMHIEVALKLRNRDVLDTFIKAAAENPLAAKPMNHDQYLANHAPTQAQAQAVVDYLTQQGFKNITISPSRMLVSADGTAATAARAFSTSFSEVSTHDGRIAFANNQDVRIPLSLQDKVLSVVGLQTANIAHVFAMRAQSVHTNAAFPTHNPLDFSSIYSGTGVKTAAGVTVGIFTNGSLAPALSDLATFTKSNGLATVSTQVVATNGGGTSTAGTDEWDIDSQDIVGMGGGQVGQLIFYTAPTLEFSDMLANFDTIVTANQAKIVNVSIGGCEVNALESGASVVSDQLLAVGVAQGQTFSISTGDSGADECNDGGVTPSWPADSPYAIAVAGTTLDATTGANASLISQTVWTGSGGSPSTFEPKPTWQYLLVSGNTRGVADVAFDADPATGANIVLNGALAQYGGTSLAAPIFAGSWARVLATKGTNFGFAAPYLYNLPNADFNQITVGNNGGETAGPGPYDFTSGRGSIILSKAINDIGKIKGTLPTANFSYTTNALKAFFTDSSAGSGGATITQHYWTFGDALPIYHSLNPGHTYVGAGTYNVSDTVSDSNGNIATKTEAVTVVPPGGANQLIQNTGFETGASGWVGSFPTGVHPFPAPGSAVEPSHGGQWEALLDGTGIAHTDSIAQQVTLGSKGLTKATLTFWLHIDTAEVTTTRNFDNLTVGVYSTGGALLGTLATFSNLNAAPGYFQYNYDMSAYLGQTVVLKFIGREDTSLQTSFVIDDVTLLQQ